MIALLMILLSMFLPFHSPSCAEDDPCWDCHTMGNQICGAP